VKSANVVVANVRNATICLDASGLDHPEREYQLRGLAKSLYSRREMPDGRSGSSGPREPIDQE
jgi:hypothetical protein